MLKTVADLVAALTPSLARPIGASGAAADSNRCRVNVALLPGPSTPISTDWFCGMTPGFAGRRDPVPDELCPAARSSVHIERIPGG
jgi:hypothetical protein